MSEDTNTQISDGPKTGNALREERLAAKLRENLRRRKAQNREKQQASSDESPRGGLPKDESQS